MTFLQANSLLLSASFLRPRKHDLALHAVLEKLKQGQRLADLTPEEKELHRTYRRDLRQARRKEVNACMGTGTANSRPA